MDRVFLFEPVGKSHRVGLSNMLDREAHKSLYRREPGKRTHGPFVGSILVSSQLHGKISEREESVRVIKTFLILAVAAFNLAVMARSIGTDEFMTNAQTSSCLFEIGRNIPFGVGKAICKFKTVVGLDAFNNDATPSEPCGHLFEEVGGGVSTLLFICAKETQTAELINGGVLEKTQLWVSNAGTWNDFHIHLNPLTGVSHLLIRPGDIRLFGFGRRQQFHASHDAEKRFGTPGVASFA